MSCPVVSPLGIHLFSCIWELKPRLLIIGGLREVEFIEPRCFVSAISESTCWQHIALVRASRQGSPGPDVTTFFTLYLWNSVQVE